MPCQLTSPQRPWPMRRPCRRKPGARAPGAPGAPAPPATAAPNPRSSYGVLLIRRPRPQSPQLPISADQAASLPSDAADQFSGRLEPYRNSRNCTGVCWDKEARMGKLLAIAVCAVAISSTCQAQAARHHRAVKVRVETRPAGGPLWHYQSPAPLGAIVTTVRDLPGKRCFSRLVENGRGWYVPHRWCEARP